LFIAMANQFELFGTEPTETLWRYTTLAKMLNMIKGEHEMHLFALQAKKFDDNYEGTLSKKALTELEASLIGGKYGRYLKDFGPVQNMYTEAVRKDIKEQFYEGAPDKTALHEMIQQMRKITFANCWNVGKYEDLNMWRAYTNHTDGVVIKSSFENINSSFLSVEGNLYVGEVNYIDFEDSNMEDHPIAPYFYKKSEFRNESEFRFVTTDYPKTSLNPNDGVGSIPSANGKIRKIKLDTIEFVDEIRVHPGSSSFLKRVVKKTLPNNIQVEVAESQLTSNLT
jgi:hypothetical protein